MDSSEPPVTLIFKGYVMRRIACVCLCSALLAAPGFGASRLNSAEKRTMELNPAVVKVSVKYNVSGAFSVGSETIQFGPETVGTFGTGFIYRPDGYIITNGHVVADAQLKDVAAQNALRDKIRIAILQNLVIPENRKRNGPPLNGNIQQMMAAVGLKAYYSRPTLIVTLANGQDYRADTKQYSDSIDMGGKDVAIIKIVGNNLPTVKLGNSSDVHVQEPITVIGYPGAASSGSLSILSEQSNMVPSVTNGHVSAVKTLVGQESVIQSDAVAGHGNSGGPAFNDANEVIGITTFGSQEESGFNFFVPINTAMEYVNTAGAKPEMGLFNRLWADALDTYDQGMCQAAKPKLQSVLNIMPSEPDALRLMAASENCIAQEGVIGRMVEGSGWILYSVAGVVILAAAFVVLSRRKLAVGVPGGAPQAAGFSGGQGRTKIESPPAVAPPATERNFGSVQVTAGPLTGKRFSITKAGLLVGKDPAKCQIVVNDDTVSHEHAWIVPVDNSVLVIDRGSTNGTYINSVESPRVSKVGIQNGDRVYLGKKGSVVLTYFSS